MANVWSTLEGGVVGVAVGTAGATVAAPAFEPARQQAWKDSQSRILELRDLAALVAQALQSVDEVLDDAERNGYHKDQLLAAIQLALKAPPYPEVLDLWRRNATRPPDEQISEQQVDHALAKAGIEYQYWPALKELINARLSAQELALAVVRGLIPDPGILPVAPPQGQGKVPRFPSFNIDTLAEALSSGFDRERFSVLVGTMGRPMSVNEAARATFRQIIERVDFDRAIAEGDIRNEWRDPLFDVAREILSATQYAESHLRGYTPDLAKMFENMAKHGMSEEDANLLFLNQGRPLAIHQITTGLARGGVYDGPTDQIPPVFLDAVRQSNIKPPYYNLDYANRYTYPSGFQIRSEAMKGDLSQPETEQILLEIGWAPKWAKFFSEKWTGVTAATKVKQLTDAEIRRAFHRSAITEQDALSRLEAGGYTAADARIYLDNGAKAAA